MVHYGDLHSVSGLAGVMMRRQRGPDEMARPCLILHRPSPTNYVLCCVCHLAMAYTM